METGRDDAGLSTYSCDICFLLCPHDPHWAAMRWRAVRLFGLLKTRPLETASLMPELLSSLYQHWVRTNQKELFRAKDLATPLRNQLPGGLKSLLQVFATPSWWSHPCFYTIQLLAYLYLCVNVQMEKHNATVVVLRRQAARSALIGMKGSFYKEQSRWQLLLDCSVFVLKARDWVGSFPVTTALCLA